MQFSFFEQCALQSIENVASHKFCYTLNNAEWLILKINLNCFFLQIAETQIYCCVYFRSILLKLTM